MASQFQNERFHNIALFGYKYKYNDIIIFIDLSGKRNMLIGFKTENETICYRGKSSTLYTIITHLNILFDSIVIARNAKLINT